MQKTLILLIILLLLKVGIKTNIITERNKHNKKIFSIICNKNKKLNKKEYKSFSFNLKIFIF